MKTRVICLTLATAFALAACAPKSDEAPSAEAALDAPGALALPGTALAIMPQDFDRLSAPDYVSLTLDNDAALVTGGREKISAGGLIKAARVTLDGAREAMVSGKTVTIHIRASSQESAPMRAAYSTNERGNSGWREFALTPLPQDFEFDYAVPQLEQGKNDYIGVLPVDPAQSIRVHAIAYTIKN